MADLLAEVSRRQDAMQQQFLEVFHQMGAATTEIATVVTSSKSDAASYFLSYDGKKRDTFPKYYSKLQLAMSTEKWQPLVKAIKTTDVNSRLFQEHYVKVLSCLSGNAALLYQDNAEFEGKGVELLIDLHARYMPASASNLIKLFIQWSTIS